MTSGFVPELVRYGLVGLLVAGVDLSVYVLLLSGTGLWYVYAHTCSRAVGGASGFLLNRRWTFGRRGRAALVSQFVKFAAIYLLSYASSTWLLYLWVELCGLSPLTAKLVSEGTVFLFNFVLLRQWAFRERPLLRCFQAEPLAPVPGRWGSADR